MIKEFPHPHATTYYDDELKLMRIKRTSENSDEEYKDSIYFMGKMIEKLKPELIIVDTIGYNYPIGVEVQDWGYKYLGDIAKKYTKKIAYVLTQDLIASLALSDMLDSAREKLSVNVRYFTSEEKAMNWLTE